MASRWRQDHQSTAGGVLGTEDRTRLRRHPGHSGKSPRRRREADHARQGRRDHRRAPELGGASPESRSRIATVPYINTNGWSDDIREKGYPEVFNPGNYNSRVAIAMADTMKALGAKSVVAFCENTDYGVGLAKLLGEQIKRSAPQASNTSTKRSIAPARISCRRCCR